MAIAWASDSNFESYEGSHDSEYVSSIKDIVIVLTSSAPVTITCQLAHAD